MTVQRREVLTAAGALLVAGVAPAAAAEHKHHSKPTAVEAVFDNALACGATGELCVAHCFEILQQGDTSIAGCAQSVNEMLAVNHAVERLAAMNSPRLGEVARAALAVYKHCENQCEKHAAKHEVCKKCANCCRDLEKAIATLPS